LRTSLELNALLNLHLLLLALILGTDLLLLRLDHAQLFNVELLIRLQLDLRRLLLGLLVDELHHLVDLQGDFTIVHAACW